MLEKAKAILNYETISYLIVGGLTTVVDYAVFTLVNELLKRRGLTSSEAALAATVAAWTVAVIFAYITNKLAVFRNYDFHPAHLLKEAAGFFGARVISCLITIVLMWLMTAILSWNEYLAKILTSVFNTIFNYVASKVFIFKN